ncbi:hypothetical protein DSECCO2_440510 [anaerobic digester metagenome]|jgi:hypothetical protein
MVSCMRCENCGEKMEKNALYCSECGFKKRVRVKHPHSTVITLGWLGVLFFMPVGFILGAYLITQDDSKAKKNGWWMVGISVVWAYIVWMVLIPLGGGY